MVVFSETPLRSNKGKYFYYGLNAKDESFLKWVGLKFKGFGIPTYITISNKSAGVFTLGFYINARNSEVLNKLREKWYTKSKNKTLKIVPSNLEITPATLLFWHLGDGCLVRRRNDYNRVPTIVIATNCFSKEDINILIGMLKELSLNFYPVEYTSGFNKGKKCGYCLYSKTEDGTPFRFFKYIGFECPKEIANFSTGSKGIYHEEKFFKNKWPTEEDWIKILSNVKVGSILRKKRLELGLSQNQFGRKVGLRRENIRDVELEKKEL